jgi:glycosyltransferase involved in cell wall biosynthesis
MRRGRRASTDRIYLFVDRPFGCSGLARTVLNLAGRLADQHEVHVIGRRRRSDESAFPIDPRVQVSFLDGAAYRSRRRTPMEEALRALPPGVVVATRPNLILPVTRFAPKHHILVGQDHLNFVSRQRQGSITKLDAAVPRLDALVVLTEADARDYRSRYAGSSVEVATIHNASPWPMRTAVTTPDKVVVAVGRLARQKGFDRLITAYAPIAAAHPDWRLHIYGTGSRRRQLAKLIEDRGLQEWVVLKGVSRDIESVLESASIYALSSRFEGFPMVLVEAMTKGVPVISFDCPRGPAEMIEHGENGLLVPNNKVKVFTRRLRRMIENEDLRAAMGAAATRSASAYQLDAVVTQWEELFDRLLAARQRR